MSRPQMEIPEKQKNSKVYDHLWYAGIPTDSTSPVSPKSSQSDAK